VRQPCQSTRDLCLQATQVFPLWPPGASLLVFYSWCVLDLLDKNLLVKKWRNPCVPLYPTTRPPQQCSYPSGQLLQNLLFGSLCGRFFVAPVCFGFVALLHRDTDLQLDLNIMLIFIPVSVSDFEIFGVGRALTGNELHSGFSISFSLKQWETEIRSFSYVSTLTNVESTLTTVLRQFHSLQSFL